MKNMTVKIGVVLLLTVQVWFCVTMFRYPYLDIDISNKNGEWVVQAIDHRSPVFRTVLKKGDTVLRIDGELPEKHVSVKRWGSIDQAKTIEFIKDGSIQIIDTSKFHTISSQDFSSFAGGLVGISISILFFFGIKHSLSSRYLSFVFLSIGFTFMSLGASLRGDLLGKISIGVCIILIPVVLVHFLIVFLNEKGKIKISNRYMKYLYGIVGLSVLPQFVYLFNLKMSSIIHNYLALFELTFFSIGILIDVIFLLYIYMKYRKTHPHLALMLKWIGIFFTLSTSPVVLLSFFSKVTSNHEWIPSEYTSWVVLLFPLSLTYLLSAKKIYDIDLVIRRFLLAIVVSFVPSILVIGLILILVSHKVRIENLMLAFTFILLLFSVTLYTLEYLTSKLERVLFPKKHYLQSSLNQISKKLGLISSFKQLKSVILIDIIDILNVHGGAIVFQHAESTEIISEGIVSHEEVMNALNDTAPSIDTGLCFELTHNQKYKSYLWLSPKKNNFMFGSEEIQWLKLIVSYLSVSMENLFLVSQMSLKLENLALQIPNENSANDIAWFRKLMFELQEKERFRIATDLHDTTMQDLFFLKRKLAALLDNYSDDWQDSEQAKSLLDYIDIINMNLRQSCFELHPYLLHELGLVRTIDKLIELERSALSFEIEFRYAGLDMIESCDMDMKRHLFRVFQELINNAKKHSNATKVHFSLNASNGKLMIQYRDNGLGFLSEQDLVREIGGSHIGLEQLKSRILSMRGVFEIKSGQGRGMSFSAVIPLKEGMTA